ncbi:MAG: DUF971 domain-containing protein [Nannocystaceae bacterium]|jgi:DUF971 family protein
MAQPLDVAHHRGENLLAIAWADGTTSELPIPYLRGWCPCAQCQGHGDVVRFHEPAADVTAVGLYEMGAYALGIRFSDGHDAGIYSWTWLRQLAPESPPAGRKRGLFRAGRFEDA